MVKQFFHTNREAIKGYNRHLILNIIKRKGPISQHNICQETKIRPATVMTFLKEFRKEGYIREVRLSKPTRGRPPRLLELNPKARYVIGVCFDGIKLKGIVTDLGGEIIYQAEDRDKLTKENVINRFSKLIRELLSKLENKNYLILGIGLGVPGLVDRTRGIALSCANLPWWNNIHFKDSLEKMFSLDVEVENDTKVLTLAEKWYGQGRGINNFLYVDVGRGIGLGIFLDNRLYKGRGKAGEFGHMTISIDGPLCRCGRRGCLETMASNLVLERELGSIPLEEVINKAKSGDSKILELFFKIGEYLGAGIVDIINLFSPTLIIIGGEFAQAGDLILSPIRKIVEEEALSKLGDDVEIKLTKFDALAGPRGTTTLILEKIFDTD